MNRIELKRGKVPRLNRRSFLAGAGVSLSLPLLEAMLPTGKTAFAQDVGSPARMLTFFVGNGVYMPAFTPAQTGADYVLSETLQPLSALKDDLLVVSGLQNKVALDNALGGTHGSYMGALLTCMRAERNKILVGGISMDQLAAQRIGSKTKLPSLALGIDSAGGGFPDNGYSAAYMGNLSWTSTTTPAPKLVSPAAIFETLFGAEAENPYTKKISVQDKSVIDAVINDAKILESQLGINDREKLQGYLNNIRELEQQLQPTNQNYDYVEKSRIMNDLMVLAFEADLTRIITYMFSNSLSARYYDHLGITQNHHDIVNHGLINTDQQLEMIKKINLYHMEELAHLLLKLKQTKDVQGKSLLDSSVVQFISEPMRGVSGSLYPTLLAGGCNGYFKTGRHINYDDQPPLANLYITMLEAMGVPVETFGADGTGILPDLKA